MLLLEEASKRARAHLEVSEFEDWLFALDLCEAYAEGTDLTLLHTTYPAAFIKNRSFHAV